MPALTSPWFQQRNPLAAQAVAAIPATPRAPSNMTEAEVEKITERVGKPTRASRAKINQSWKLENTFMDSGRHSWAKMELYADCKKCMWRDNGSIKQNSCKIRPIVPTKVNGL
ncbi:hypothetical protein FSP39_011480 [Pinctada imbricata]|uniref:Uncharacterized protein n=1 Tax=Pinctada imbricata TaxID=66713 RepID=A0AA88Y827_PINIB|nr:hypothetical protein FSP39_011480 [Pinctada imbricata]